MMIDESAIPDQRRRAYSCRKKEEETYQLKRRRTLLELIKRVVIKAFGVWKPTNTLGIKLKQKPGGDWRDQAPTSQCRLNMQVPGTF